MDRVWRRVQGATGGGGGGGRKGGRSACCGCPIQPCQLHVDQRAKRGGGGRRSRSAPRTIVCNCQVQPCPVHPVLVRVRRNRTATNINNRESDCDCPQDRPCNHSHNHDHNHTPRGSRRVNNRRCGCSGEDLCHHHQQHQLQQHHVASGVGGLLTNDGTPRRQLLSLTGNSIMISESVESSSSSRSAGGLIICDCIDKSACPGHPQVIKNQTLTRIHPQLSGINNSEIDSILANPCPHAFKNRSSSSKTNNVQSSQCGIVDCISANNQQPSSCVHKPQNEGRIKRVKCRVRRAGCAMARCTAELAMLHLHWELATECAPCRPRALTRRLCRRQQSDNELYRSNSFKFERFERTREEHSTPVRNQISLCDDYSLPVDFVNKRRPASVAVAATSTVQWALPSPTTENAEVEVVEQYSDPRDSKTKSYSEPIVDAPLPTTNAVNYAKINRDYCRPYTDPSASESSCADDEGGPASGTLPEIRRRKGSIYKSGTTGKSSPSLFEEETLLPGSGGGGGDAVIVDCVALVHLAADQSPTDPNQPIRHPSPYYYGDLFKAGEELARPQPGRYRKSVSLDVPAERSRTPGLPKRNSVAGDGVGSNFEKNQDLVSPTSGSEQHAVPNIIDRNEILSSCIITEWDNTLMPPHRLLSHDIPSAVCTCAVLSDRDEEDVEPPTRQARKLRRTRRIDPQLILIEDEADEELEEEDEETGEKADAEMARQRRLYETAFDCKVSRSDDDLDDLDRVTNHPVLHAHSRVSGSSPSAVDHFNEFEPVNNSPEIMKGSSVQGVYSLSKERRKVVLLRPKPIPSRLIQQQQQQQQQSDNISTLSQELESIHVNSSDEKKSSSSPRLPLRGYQPAPPSPPSTAPLPAKFHGRKDHLLLNIRSAPNLPAQTDHPRLKDTRLPVKSLRAKESPQSSECSILEIKGRPKNDTPDQQGRRLDKELILEFKGRPKEERQRPRSLIRETRPIMEFKGRPHEAEEHLPRPRRESGLLDFKLRTTRRRVGYSSTESMATSSSGGSMESLRSSTSEGNRSTSSSESRHSMSLSSHSSDSGSTSCVHNHQQNTLSGFITHANKLHILSPISDKSSQEPASETSDNNRNNNSQKGSPEEVIQNIENSSGNVNNVTSPTDTSFKKRRTPQNKNLINLALQSSSSGDAEIQGSDSGISIESRAGIKCKPFGFHLLKPQLDNLNLVDNEPELNDLPFDMPKLRRRRLLLQQDATTSGSATSVDLRDLPFDMPKLRRRLRCTQSVESSASQASSSLSVRDVDVPVLFGGSTSRPKMTLNLDSNGDGTGGNKITMKKPGLLSLGLPLEISSSRASADLVDADLPLERQGWYHGSITRIEAEAVLRLLREGSYLVRNSESTKQDYSLSLKSARGFMHMRIQRNEELNAYILGQFSKPFETIPEMVRHFSVNRLPIRGAEHMCLLHPVIAQLL